MISHPPKFVYISPALLWNMRREISRFLLHTYTRSSRISTPSTEDTWGQQTYTFSASVSGIPCFYAVKEIPVVTPEGVTTLNLPVLTLLYDDSIQIGDHVSNIITADGSLILAGPVVAEKVLPRDPNMGGPVMIEVSLRDVQFVATSS